MYLSDIYTLAVNLAGLPGASLPAGLPTMAARWACSRLAITSAKPPCWAPPITGARHRLARPHAGAVTARGHTSTLLRKEF